MDSRITAAVSSPIAALDRLEVVERDVDEPGGSARTGPDAGSLAASASPVGRGSRRSPRRALAAGVGAGQLEREVDGLAAPTANTTPGSGRRCWPRAARPAGPPAGDQVVVADVEVVEALADRGDDPGVAVAEVEDAAVAVAVDTGAGRRRREPRPALAHHDVEAELLVGGTFPRLTCRANAALVSSRSANGCTDNTSATNGSGGLSREFSRPPAPGPRPDHRVRAR